VNGREWIRKSVLQRRELPVPYNFMFSPPASAALARHFGRADVAEAIALPIRMTSPKSIKPLYAAAAKYGPTIKDEFGVVWSTSDIDRGSPVGPCCVGDDLSGYQFPDPAAEYRFEDIGRWCLQNREHYTFVWVGDLWERATFMRGMERLLLDVATAPANVEELLRGLADYILATMEILFDRFEFDGVALSDDYGAQSAMLISPADWRRLVGPLLAEIYNLAKRHGRSVFHHSCGNIVPIVPDLIDIGLDILHPIQPEAMDIQHLKREFGADLSFCGGLGTQKLLPAGLPGQIRAQVRRLKETMGAGGGYILEPGITVQADVPLDNMLAMIDEAQKPL